jgi:hypothetical protein
VPDRRSLGKTGLYDFTCLSYGGAVRRRKIGGLTVLFAAASKVFFSPKSIPYTTKFGCGYTGNASKRLATHRILKLSVVLGN